ncbi:hypothetical protein F442_19354 [Phytophthora nicotianae P10297]|uniref:Uncharacterized protein n=1 Tax=Phytophthora nicotianae P10297 TaxID=1317064 RepID=W2YB04_PHYNI|nr:hypothetical protein F442_19354 [Phytophthora nicotianae P10297]
MLTAATTIVTGTSDPERQIRNAADHQERRCPPGKWNYFHGEYNMRMTLATKERLAHVQVVKPENEIMEVWLVNDAKALSIIAHQASNACTSHTLVTTVAGEIFQQDRWMNGTDEVSNEPNKRAVDTQDRAQRNSEGSQAERTRDHKEE